MSYSEEHVDENGNVIDNYDYFYKINIDVIQLIMADFCAGAVLITFGVLLGKISFFQFWVVATIEVIFYTLNEAIVIEIFKITDIGGSIVIHTFGAVFGIAASFFFQPAEAIRNKFGRDGSTYASDIIAMIGTLFLWMYWPSFNGALGTGS